MPQPHHLMPPAPCPPLALPTPLTLYLALQILRQGAYIGLRYHLRSADTPLLMYELAVRGYRLRALAHPGHWVGPMGAVFDRFGTVSAPVKFCLWCSLLQIFLYTYLLLLGSL